jgi:hypothetical protein
MSLFGVEHLDIIDVLDKGSPNLERIAIYVKENCDLRDYILLIGHRNIDGSATPIKDNMLWFGVAELNKGDWIFVYTAPGTTTIQPIEGTNSKLHSIHWGKDHTIFQNGGLVPMLCQISGVAMPEIPQPQAHDKRLTSN